MTYDHRHAWETWPDGQVRCFECDMPQPETKPNITPTPAAIRAFLKTHGLTGAQAARNGYLSGGQVVRKYTAPTAPHRLSGAVWFAWHAHALLDAESIARIEAAMASSAQVGEP